MSQVFPGENLELAIRRSGVSISEIAKRMHVNRRTVYNWFQQPSLRFEIVRDIGYIIRHDFSKEFPELLNENGFSVRKSEVQTNKAETPSIHYWMAKYIELLEKYNQALTNTDKDLPEGELAC